MSKTKTKILEASRHLFNKHGFSQVTIRMIAQEVGISSGNLNYHYKTRDSILEDLYFEMVLLFDERIETLDGQKFTIQSIKNDIELSMEQMVKYRFFWTDLYNLLALNSSIREHFDNAYTARINGCIFLFRYLIEAGILTEKEHSADYKVLATLLIDFGNTWLYSSRLYNKNELEQNEIANQAFRYLYILYPHLSKNGKEEFRSLFAEYLDK